MKYVLPTAFVVVAACQPICAGEQAGPAKKQVVAAMRQAAEYYRTKVASHGGYVYHYSLDLKQRWGEGAATPDQIWVQPPGTPTVGMAYMRAYEATGDRYFLDAALEATQALMYGQLESGGWTNCIDFNPRGARVARYRNGRGRGRNVSSLDDGQTQSALQLLMQTDKALSFQNKKVHDAAQLALSALLRAQFANGAFPQGWTGPVARRPITRANYPKYDWRTEGRIRNYWDMYTLNDNVPGYVTDTLIDAYRIYKDEKYKAAVRRLGDFLILAQMPEPQPAWAQQYNYDMQPIWARRFEPAGISGDESQETMQTLMTIYRFTGDKKYLEPIPRAVAYLKRSLLADGRLARFYELKTNKPLYMKRRGKVYTLTYDDSNLPSHYGWKTGSRLGRIETMYNDLKTNGPRPLPTPSVRSLGRQARRIVQDLDDQGRWISTATGERLVGQPRIKDKSRYLSSAVFARNMEILSRYVAALPKP